MDFEHVEKQALSLPAAGRARLAHELLDSIDNMSREEVRKLWLDEAERRAAEIDSGASTLIPGDEVSRKARALLR
jgi:putative addiction module component (TIGR02574 family)